MESVKKIFIFLLLLAVFIIPPASASCMGTISVFTNPAYAKVYLDGSLQGETSPNYAFQLKGVPCGTHTVEVKLEGYQPYSEEVSVEASTGYKVSAKLSPIATATTAEATTETPATEATATTPGILPVTVVSGVLISIFGVLALRKE